MAAKHTVLKTFRLTKSEAENLAKLAKDRNMNESEYIRLVLSGKPNDYPELRILLKKLINEVNHIGNNINQIAKRANMGMFSDKDLQDTKSYMRKVNTSLKEVVTMIGSQ